MATEQKSAPAGAPPALAALPAGLEQAIRHPERRPGARISLVVEGGAPGERYHFSLRATPDGAAACELRCDLAGRAARAEPQRIDFAALARAIDPAALLEADLPAPRFPPDSVVGRLEISDGEQTLTLFYMADPEQAKAAGFQPPAAIARASEAIYAQGARLLGSDDIRP